jgi:hypothetical protein
MAARVLGNASLPTRKGAAMNTRRFKVLCPMENEKTGKTYWMRVGTGFPNADGSTNILLDALPINRKLHVRELDERDLAPRKNGESTPPADGLPF